MSIRILSLGAGVQSTALLLLAAAGDIPSVDLAIFADTGWEPKAVIDHLDRVEAEIAVPAGIPIVRVSYGDILADTLSPDYSAPLPVYTVNADGSAGMVTRQCTTNYKLVPIFREVRRRLGATETLLPCRKCEATGERVTPWSIRGGSPRRGECSVCRGTGNAIRVGVVPKGTEPVEMMIGFSTDEVVRVGRDNVPYIRKTYPLLDLGWTRGDCSAYLDKRGFVGTRKSACIGCPYHGNDEWRDLRDNDPASFASAVALDNALRPNVPGMPSNGSRAYLHPSRVPLAFAPIDRLTTRERGGEQLTFDTPTFDGDSAPGCSPWACRSDAGIDAAIEAEILAADEAGSI